MNTLKIFLYSSILSDYSWSFKRIMLNLIWGLLNVASLIFITTIVIGTKLEIIWYTTVILYVFVYWILATMLFDKLIGDGIDND